MKRPKARRGGIRRRRMRPRAVEKASEWLDVFDERGRWWGWQDRDTVHRRGLWHRTFHCWVLLGEPDAEAPSGLLLQRRSASKRTHPGCLDVAAAGHLRAGEPVRSGVREVAEELGRAPAWGELIPLGVTRTVLTGPGWVDRERCHEFLWVTRERLEAFRPDPDEVEALVVVDWADAGRLFAGTLARVTATVREAAASRTDVVEVTMADFVPRGRLYWRRHWDAIARVSAGEAG